MNELNKISRIVERELPNAAKEVLLVLDGTTGQNGLIQAKAFKEVADALATEGTIEAELKAQADLAASTKQAYDLAQARYKQGSSSFLEVLESQRQWVGAQTGLVVAEQARAASLVMLYKTLGGGAVDSEPKEAQK
jgi:multidrug efflux system outer membrane protein